MFKSILLGCLSAILISGCATQRGFPPVQGIQNFDKVDGRLYRGAQPNYAGLCVLKQLGITKVINLRQPGDTWPQEETSCKALGIQYVNIPLPGLWEPTREKMEQILAEIKKAGPDASTFVHCQYGCDRTGTVVACYRIRENKSSNRDALKEAEIFGMAAFEVKMKEFILHFR